VKKLCACVEYCDGTRCHSGPSHYHASETPCPTEVRLDEAAHLLHVASDFWFDSSKVMGAALTEGGKAELTAEWHDRVTALLEHLGVDYYRAARKPRPNRAEAVPSAKEGT
jgi:hypothetical protein